MNKKDKSHVADLTVRGFFLRKSSGDVPATIPLRKSVQKVHIPVSSTMFERQRET